MSYPKLTSGVLVLLLLPLFNSLHSQNDCPTLPNFDFPTHWGQLSLHKSLEHYFSALDRRDGWAAILFPEEEEVLTPRSIKGIDPRNKEAIELIYHFESGRHRKANEKYRVVVNEQSGRPVHWVVKDAEKIQSFLTSNDFNHFFISRPNKSQDIDYCSENLIVKSWECWVSFRAYAKTVLLKGATVMLLQEGRLAEHWEMIDFQEVLKGWGIVEN